jgi:hypothetical protein
MSRDHKRDEMMAKSPWSCAALAMLLIAGMAACAPRDEQVASNPEITADSIPVQHWDTIAGTNWTTEDWRILDEKVRWAAQQRLDTLPIGEGIARLGATFVGTTYTPGTLEAPGPEHLVINLRELDCVTFIENVLAMTWLIRNEGQAVLSDQAAAMRRYEQYLTAVRYRNSELNGYPSRLHYFSEWLSENQAKGLLHIRTQELGGVPDPERITFMTGHRDAYKQLADSAFFAEIGRMETRLNAQGPRYYRAALLHPGGLDHAGGRESDQERRHHRRDQHAPRPRHRAHRHRVLEGRPPAPDARAAGGQERGDQPAPGARASAGSHRAGRHHGRDAAGVAGRAAGRRPLKARAC